jgi:hypothetical protein
MYKHEQAIDSVEAAFARAAARQRRIEEERQLQADDVLELSRYSPRVIHRRTGIPLRRVRAILRHRGEPAETGATDANADALDNVVIATGSPQGAYGRAKRLGAFDCQPDHPIRPTASHLACASIGVIHPEIFAIEHIAPSVGLDAETVAALAASKEPYGKRLAELVQTYLDEGVWPEGTRRQIVLLSRLDDPRTKILERPIRHFDSSPFTRNRRYVALQALTSGIDNTNDLLKLQMSLTPEAPGTTVVDPSIRAVALKINLAESDWRRMSAKERYERTAFAWATNPLNHCPDYAFPVSAAGGDRGICLEVYRIGDWEQVADRRRWRFHGELDDELTERYGGVDISADVGRGANPIRYLNC